VDLFVQKFHQKVGNLDLMAQDLELHKCNDRRASLEYLLRQVSHFHLTD